MFLQLLFTRIMLGLETLLGNETNVARSPWYLVLTDKNIIVFKNSEHVEILFSNLNNLISK